ncbi:MAG: hypothetical protein ABIG42_08065 [bacterium]
MLQVNEIACAVLSVPDISGGNFADIELAFFAMLKVALIVIGIYVVYNLVMGQILKDKRDRERGRLRKLQTRFGTWNYRPRNYRTKPNISTVKPTSTRVQPKFIARRKVVYTGHTADGFRPVDEAAVAEKDSVVEY